VSAYKSLVVCALPLLAAACASVPETHPGVVDLRENVATLPRTVAIEIGTLEEGDPAVFGTRDDWEAEFRRVFEAADVAADVVPHDVADLRIHVELVDRDPKDPAVDREGALLWFLAWSTVPLLPWIIEDVQVDPGVGVDMRWALREGGEPESLSIDLGGYVESASLWDRQPFWAWRTFAAIVVPPFAWPELRKTDRGELAETIGDRVRFEVALRVAKAVKMNVRIDNELLRDVSAERTSDSTIRVRFLPHRDLMATRYRFEAEGVEPASWALIALPPVADDEDPELWSRDIPLPPDISADADVLIRLEAKHRRKNLVLPYSVRVAPLDSEAIHASGSP